MVITTERNHMFWINERREYQKWQRLAERARRWVDEPAPFLFERAEYVSEWSPAQHLYHLAIGHKPVLRWLIQQAEAPDADPEGRPNIAGYLVLTLGRFPRGRGRAPKAFHPPDTVERDDLARRMETNRDMLDALDAQLDALKQVRGRLNHPALGRLDAGEWLRFGHIHTAHHYRIIRDIRTEREAS